MSSNFFVENKTVDILFQINSIKKIKENVNNKSFIVLTSKGNAKRFKLKKILKRTTKIFYI